MQYTPNTIRRAESILRYGIKPSTEERTYTVIDNVVYTDVFDDSEITIQGYTGSFRLAFNGVFNGIEYYNEIHLLSKCLPRAVKIETAWGSKCLIKELEELLDWLKDNTFEDNIDNAGAKSLKIEDFSITGGTPEETQKAQYNALMANYSFYIRNPILIGVSPEWKDDYRHF